MYAFAVSPHGTRPPLNPNSDVFLMEFIVLPPLKTKALIRSTKQQAGRILPKCR